MSNPTDIKSCLDQVQKKGVALSEKKCDRCATQFKVPDAMIGIATGNPAGFQLDIGGYCGTCQEFICQQHARLQAVQDHVVQNLKRSPLGKDLAGLLPPGQLYWPSCTKCGTPLRSGVDTKMALFILIDPNIR